MASNDTRPRNELNDKGIYIYIYIYIAEVAEVLSWDFPVCE